VDKNDIPDLIAKWPKREISDKSWFTTIEQIRATDFNLTAGRYKPVTVERVNHDAPKEILGSVLKLENEIIRRGDALLAQIGWKK
jgi:type I restriction enzyme M protein